MLTEASGSSCFLFLRSFHLQTQSQYLIRFDGKGNGMIRHLQFSFFYRIFQKIRLPGFGKCSVRGQSHRSSGIIHFIKADDDSVSVLSLLHSFQDHIFLIHT